MTMSMKMRSGCICRASRTPSAPSVAVAVRKPWRSSAFCITCTSVGESSTMRISAMRVISQSSTDMRFDRIEQLVLGEGLGQIVLRAHDASARAIEQPVLRGEHDDRNRAEYFVVLDERAGLVAVEARHHDIDKYDVRLMIGNLGERIEAVHRREDLTAFLAQECLGGAPDRLAVIDDQDLQTAQRGGRRAGRRARKRGSTARGAWRGRGNTLVRRR